MTPLAAQRCLNHFDREAIARCVACQGFFCRECITEHDQRILCRSCLQATVAPVAGAGRPFFRRVALPTMAAVTGLIVAWFCFYTIGRGLLSVPSDFHPETLWAGKWQIGGGDE
jgi:hypothetical protein